MENVKTYRPMPSIPEYIEMMKAYIEKLKAMPEEEAHILNRQSLIETGVLKSDGTLKEHIVDNF